MVSAARRREADGGVPWPPEPMLAKPTNRLPTAKALPGGCLYEPKWDGYRALVAVSPAGHPHIRSRRSTDLTRGFPEITSAAAEQLKPGTLLDGELVIWDGDHLTFSALQQRIVHPNRAQALARAQPASFVIFDALQIDHHTLSDEPLHVRRAALEALTPHLAPPLQVTPATHDTDTARTWMSDYAAAGVGIEGLVIKGLADRYQPGRRSWLKLRIQASVEAVVGAVGGRPAKPQRLLLGLPNKDGELELIGTTGLLNDHQSQAVGQLLQPMGDNHPWPPDITPGGFAAWGARDRQLPITRVDPTLVVEVEADAAYQHGQFRHIARLIRARPDLKPAEVDRLAEG